MESEGPKTHTRVSSHTGSPTRRQGEPRGRALAQACVACTESSRTLSMGGGGFCLSEVLPRGGPDFWDKELFSNRVSCTDSRSPARARVCIYSFCPPNLLPAEERWR